MSSVPPPSGSWQPPLELREGLAAPSTPPPVRDTDGREEQPSWPPWTAIVVIVVALAFALVASLFVGVFAAVFGASLTDPPPGVNIAATVLQDVAFVGAALVFARRAGPLRLSQFGVRATRLWAAVGWAALAMIAFYAFSALWAAALDVQQEDKLPDSFGVHDSTVALVAVCVVVTVIAPIAEELLFRGYIFAALRTWRGPWLAAVLTGLLFGAIHVGSAPVVFLVPLAVLGFLLCLLRWRTGSLLPCMAVHAFNNAIAFSVTDAEWGAGATLLVIVGAIATILLVSMPFVRAGERPDARALI